MGVELFFIAVIILMAFAVMDLIVGVSNDAVNFLNSSFGSRVASRRVVLMIASLGIMTGVVFSSGMMEVARKGIFHPQLFTMPELMTIFLAVMLTDIVLLDLFNTFGLPTSTTVSIVFELLGAAVVVSALKIIQISGGIAGIGQYINSEKALVIVAGILLSVIVAFFSGAIIQYLSRLIFTFDYRVRLKKYGALWGGVAMASITYVILVKGAKGISFVTPEIVAWITAHTMLILLVCFIASAIILQVLLLLGFHILKPIVLAGTFALALAFAANDLVNFIGVPMAGLHSYKAAIASADPLNVPMAALSGKVQSETVLLLIAGAIMVVTLWFSRKARTVSKTELSLGQQEEGQERFGAIFLSRAIVRMVFSLFEGIKFLAPRSVRESMAKRIDPERYRAEYGKEGPRSFDLLRAATNLMVASAVVSFATSQKLPLSTTYVTFMVSMGTSFADQAWGRDSAVYRVTGVLTVVGGWFMTALMAFTLAGICATIIYYTEAYGVGALLMLIMMFLWRTHHKHAQRVKVVEEDLVFNLKKIKDPQKSISTTFEHASYLIGEIRRSLEITLNALFAQDENRLRKERKKTGKIQNWTNIIIANVFKTMRLLQKSDAEISHKYAQTIRRLQKLADGHRDIVMRAYEHVSNYHKGLLDIQIEELKEVSRQLLDILQEVESTLNHKQIANHQSVVEKDELLRQHAERLNQDQILRIQDESSKTRLSILFYALVGNAMMLSKQTLKLLEIFGESFEDSKHHTKFDLD